MMVIIQESRCPLCQADNNCMINSDQTCWCMGSNISSTLIDSVPSCYKNKACICQRCIEKQQQLKSVTEKKIR